MGARGAAVAAAAFWLFSACLLLLASRSSTTVADHFLMPTSEMRGHGSSSKRTAAPNHERIDALSVTKGGHAYLRVERSATVTKLLPSTASDKLQCVTELGL